MKLESLRLKGIGCFQDEISLPVDQLTEADRVIAVVGKNGAGKSTFLESIPALLYGESPSRGAVAAMANTKNSYIEGEIETDRVYRLRRTINATLKKPKIEAYLWNEDGTPVGESDGKLTTFSREVEKIFPSKAILLSGGFASQNKAGQFLEIQKSERKAMFAELLRLGHLQKMSQAASDRVKAAEAGLVAAKAKIAALNEQIERDPMAKQAMLNAKNELAEAVHIREQAEIRAANARRMLEVWQKESSAIDKKALEASIGVRDAERHQEHVNSELDEVRKELDEAEERSGRVEGCIEAVENAEAKAIGAKDTREKSEANQALALAAMERWSGKLAMLEKEEASAKACLSEARRKQDHLTAELKRMQAELAKVVAKKGDVDTRLRQRDRFQGELDVAKGSDEKIAKIEKEIKDLREKDVSYRQEEKSWRSRHDAAEVALRKCTEAYKEAVHRAESDFRLERQQHDATERTASELGAVPCHGEGDYAVCPLLTTATNAAKALSPLARKLAETEERLKTTKADKTDGKAARAVLDAIGDAPKAPDTSVVGKFEKSLVALRKSQAVATEARARLEALGEAEKQSKELDTEMVELQKKIDETRSALPFAESDVCGCGLACKTAEDALSDQGAVRPTVGDEAALKMLRSDETFLAAKLATAKEALVAAKREAEETETLKANLEVQITTGLDALSKAKVDTSDAIEARKAANRSQSDHEEMKPVAIDELELQAIRKHETEATAELARAQEALDAIEKAAEQVKQLAGEISTETEDLDDWKHLRQAFGREGIQSLEVDAAGPEVSGLINELLSACYGPRFVVKLETTAPLADGKGGTKEIFDLHVIDAEKGWEGSASNLSGGERVFVTIALGLAIAIYNVQRSSIPILDIILDECSGSLDFEKAPLYVTMLRKAIEIGGFHRIFFIVHQRELWALADAIINVENGQCRVVEAE